MSHPYHARRAVLSTKHDKLPLVGPPLARHVGLIVHAVPVDTDRLGTFTGDIARTGSPWDTAVAKARLGMSAARCSIGIASEGSIGPHPSAPFINAVFELVVLVDDELGIVIGETEVSVDIIVVSADVTAEEDVEDLLRRGRFPAHGMTVRPAAQSARSSKASGRVPNWREPSASAPRHRPMPVPESRPTCGRTSAQRGARSSREQPSASQRESPRSARTATRPGGASSDSSSVCPVSTVIAACRSREPTCWAARRARPS